MLIFLSATSSLDSGAVLFHLVLIMDCWSIVTGLDLQSLLARGQWYPNPRYGLCHALVQNQKKSRSAIISHVSLASLGLRIKPNK